MTCDWEIHRNCHTEAGVKPWGGTHGALLSLAPRAAARDRPECSSFTSDDIVFVIESAATSRSFRRFLGTPGGGRNGRGHATQQINARRCDWPFFFFAQCGSWFSPWAKASSTSPPTPARQSWGVWVGVEPAEVERMGIGMEHPAPWLGEEWGEPPDWDATQSVSQDKNRKHSTSTPFYSPLMCLMHLMAFIVLLFNCFILQEKAAKALIHHYTTWKEVHCHVFELVNTNRMYGAKVLEFLFFSESDIDPTSGENNTFPHNSMGYSLWKTCVK